MPPSNGVNLKIPFGHFKLTPSHFQCHFVLDLNWHWDCHWLLRVQKTAGALFILILRETSNQTKYFKKVKKNPSTLRELKILS